ncbi:hypothetical protein ABIE58_003960 [Roseovarius sp. MBR-78]|uniref:hypothetical protein n=1 Tax=Roseovarius sp. MBR-78 TaxID=3156460 RepID=UPI0033913E5F
MATNLDLALRTKRPLRDELVFCCNADLPIAFALLSFQRSNKGVGLVYAIAGGERWSRKFGPVVSWIAARTLGVVVACL